MVGREAEINISMVSSQTKEVRKTSQSLLVSEEQIFGTIDSVYMISARTELTIQDDY